jgi:16S rRNA (cytidine1402-2'-O)-methyltransferase
LAGALILVATPIGNMGDLSPRAIEVLRTADAICCEDSRRTGRLLAHAGINRTSPLPVSS